MRKISKEENKVLPKVNVEDNESEHRKRKFRAIETNK